MSNEFLPFDETAFDDGRVLVAEHGFRLATNNLAGRAERMPMFSRAYPLRGPDGAVKGRRVCTVEPAWIGPWVVPSAVERTIRVIGECVVERGGVDVALFNETTGEITAPDPLTTSSETFSREITCNPGENILWLRVVCSTFADPDYLPSDFTTLLASREVTFGLVSNSGPTFAVVPPMQFAMFFELGDASTVAARAAPEFAVSVTDDDGLTIALTVSDISTRNVLSTTEPNGTGTVASVTAVLWEEPPESFPLTSIRGAPIFPVTSGGPVVTLLGISALEIKSLHFEQTKTIDLDTIGFAADTHFAQRPSATVFASRALTARGLHRARFPVVQLGMGVGTFPAVLTSAGGHSAAYYTEQVDGQPGAAIPLIYRCTAKLLRDLFPPGTDDAAVVINVAVPVAAFRRFRTESVSRYRVKIATLTDTLATGAPVALNAETTPLANTSQYAPTSPRLFRMAARSTISGCWSITATNDRERWGILRASAGPLTRDVSGALDDEEFIGLILERVGEDGEPEPTSKFDYIAIGEPTWWISEVL